MRSNVYVYDVINSSTLECLICGGGEDAGVVKAEDAYNLLKCHSCGSIFADRESRDVKDKFESNSARLSFIHDKPRQVVADAYIKYLDQQVGLSSIKSALDIGAAQGHFVKELQSRGIDASGLEPNKMLVEHAVTKGIIQCFFDVNYPIDRKYDLVCLTQILCYIRDSVSILKKARELGRTVFVATINGDDPRILHDFGDKGNVYNRQCVPTKRGLEIICEKAGLKITDYSIYEPAILLEPMISKVKALKHMIGGSKSFYPSEAGYHVFMILQPN